MLELPKLLPRVALAIPVLKDDSDGFEEDVPQGELLESPVPRGDNVEGDEYADTLDTLPDVPVKGLPVPPPSPVDWLEYPPLPDEPSFCIPVNGLGRKELDVEKAAVPATDGARGAGKLKLRSGPPN